MAARVTDISENAIETVGVKIAAAHGDDGAETAVKGAAARGLHDVHWPAEHGVAAEHAGVATRQFDFIAFKTVDGPRWVVRPA